MCSWTWFFPDSIGPDRARDVFEVLLAEIGEINADLASDMIVSRGRDTDAAGVGDAFKPRRNIHAVSKDVMWLDNYVADIDANTESNSGAFRVGGRKFFDAGLKLQGCSNRSDCARKLRQETIASILDDAASVFGDRGCDAIR